METNELADHLFIKYLLWYIFSLHPIGQLNQNLYNTSNFFISARAMNFNILRFLKVHIQQNKEYPQIKWFQSGKDTLNQICGAYCLKKSLNLINSDLIQNISFYSLHM